MIVKMKKAENPHNSTHTHTHTHICSLIDKKYFGLNVVKFAVDFFGGVQKYSAVDFRNYVTQYCVASKKLSRYVIFNKFSKKSFFQFKYQRVFKNNDAKIFYAMQKCIAICDAVKSKNAYIINKNNGARAPVKFP